MRLKELSASNTKLFIKENRMKTQILPRKMKQPKKKREKAGGEPEVVMITPEPIIMEKESGREFEI